VCVCVRVRAWCVRVQICNAGLYIPMNDCMSENCLAIAYTALVVIQIPLTTKQEQLNEFNNQRISYVY